MASSDDSDSTVQATSRRFTFSDGDQHVRLVIPEVVNPMYGMYVWPCAPVLAQYVWYHRHQVKNKRVLELGAGTALPGILAATCAAEVTLSDSVNLKHCLDNCRNSCLANNLNQIKVVGLTWGQIGPDLLQLGPHDIILASDCFYDPKDFEDILVTVAYLLEQNCRAEFWCTYQERSSDWSIEDLLKKWQLDCTHIPLSNFDADSTDLAGSSLPGHHTIHMLVISRSKCMQ